MNVADIPGLAEAKAWEASVRARAFLDVPYTVCGVEVLPLTLYRLALLDAAGSVFLYGGAVTPAAVALFLWIASPDFRAGDDGARALFIARLRTIDALADLAECSRQIGEFLEEMFLDSPAASGGGKGSTPTTSQEAVYCEIFAESCGWSVEQTMHTALPKLYQVLRRITLRKDHEAKFINRRSDKVRGDFQRSLQAAAAVTAPTGQPS